MPVMKVQSVRLWSALITLIILGCATVAQAAEFHLGALAGNWSGSGSYTEGISTARLICRLTASGDDRQVHMTGRCGSSLGNEDVDMVLVRAAEGTVTVSSGTAASRRDSPVENLQGVPEGNQLVARGSAEDEVVTLVLRFEDTGVLRFAVQRRWTGGKEESVVDLSAR